MLATRPTGGAAAREAQGGSVGDPHPPHAPHAGATPLLQAIPPTPGISAKKDPPSPADLGQPILASGGQSRGCLIPSPPASPPLSPLCLASMGTTPSPAPCGDPPGTASLPPGLLLSPTAWPSLLRLPSPVPSPAPSPPHHPISPGWGDAPPPPLPHRPPHPSGGPWGTHASQGMSRGSAPHCRWAWALRWGSPGGRPRPGGHQVGRAAPAAVAKAAAEPGNGSRSFPTSFLPSSSSSSLVSLFLCLSFFFFLFFFLEGQILTCRCLLATASTSLSNRRAGCGAAGVMETAEGRNAPAPGTPQLGRGGDGIRTQMNEASGQDGAGRGVASRPLPWAPSPPRTPRPREASPVGWGESGFPRL